MPKKVDKDDPDYAIKRDQNNKAIKRTRVKKKNEQAKTLKEIAFYKEENREEISRC